MIDNNPELHYFPKERSHFNTSVSEQDDTKSSQTWLVHVQDLTFWCYFLLLLHHNQANALIPHRLVRHRAAGQWCGSDIIHNKAVIPTPFLQVPPLYLCVKQEEEKKTINSIFNDLLYYYSHGEKNAVTFPGLMSYNDFFSEVMTFFSWHDVDTHLSAPEHQWDKYSLIMHQYSESSYHDGDPFLRQGVRRISS